MKIRTGFVSNSSSSSFVIALPHKPKDQHDLQHMMFGTQNVHYIDSCYAEEPGKNEIETYRIAESVFNKIKRKATKNEIIESIRDGSFDSYIEETICPGNYDIREDPEWEKLHKLKQDDPQYFKRMNKLYKKIYDINDQRATNIYKFFTSNNKGKYFVVMNFCDNNSSFEGALEHTNIFSRLEYIQTSYH